MLKKFLPNSKQNQSQPQSQQNGPIKDLTPQSDLEYKSPNLLDQFNQASEKDDHVVLQAIRTLKIFIIFLPVVFVATLFFSDIYDLRINSLDKKIENTRDEILQYRNTAEAVNTYAKKVELLKQIRETTPNASGKISLIKNASPADVTINSMKYTGSAIGLELISDTPLSISLAITNYLKDPLVSDLVLKSVARDTAEGKYVSALELHYK